MASTIYQKPVDSKIYSSVDLDVTDVMQYITEKRKQGVKVTLTYLLTLMLGRSIRNEVMELNAFVRRGKIVQRDQVDATISVLLPGGQMGSVKVDNADKLTIEELVSFVGKQIASSRKGTERDEMQSKNLLSSLPWPFRNWLFKFYRLLTVSWGVSIRGTGLSANSFGSYLVSDIGALGLDSGFGSLLPASNISFVIVLGNVIKKPVIINDEIVVRKAMKMSATVDHRVADGSHGGRLFRGIKKYMKNPALLEAPPTQE